MSTAKNLEQLKELEIPKPLQVTDLFDDSNDFADMIQSKGWQTLLKHIHETIYQKNAELANVVFHMTVEDTPQIRARIVDLKAELRVLAGAFGIPRNVIDASIKAREERDVASEETTNVPQPPKLVLAQH